MPPAHVFIVMGVSGVFSLLRHLTHSTITHYKNHLFKHPAHSEYSITQPPILSHPINTTNLLHLYSIPLFHLLFLTSCTGCGKSTIAEELSHKEPGWIYYDADTLHPPEVILFSFFRLLSSLFVSSFLFSC